MWQAGQSRAKAAKALEIRSCELRGSAKAGKGCPLLCRLTAHVDSHRCRMPRDRSKGDRGVRRSPFRLDGAGRFCLFPGDPGVPLQGGPNGHFYTADAAECEAVKRDLGWRFESYDFSTTPAQAHVCPTSLTPVYRAYNNRAAQNDSNHRFTPDAQQRAAMAMSWIDEGVAFCSPS